MFFNSFLWDFFYFSLFLFFLRLILRYRVKFDMFGILLGRLNNLRFLKSLVELLFDLRLHIVYVYFGSEFLNTLFSWLDIFWRWRGRWGWFRIGRRRYFKYGLLSHLLSLLLVNLPPILGFLLAYLASDLLLINWLCCFSNAEQWELPVFSPDDPYLDDFSLFNSLFDPCIRGQQEIVLRRQVQVLSSNLRKQSEGILPVCIG